MRKLLILLILGAIGFYVGWPVYSAWQIKSALQNGDAGILSSKIDFDSIRTSLKPGVAGRGETA